MHPKDADGMANRVDPDLFTQTCLSKIYTVSLWGRSSSTGCVSAWYVDGRRFDPHIWQHSFVEFGLEIISTALLSLSPIQEGQLSVTAENVH